MYRALSSGWACVECGSRRIRTVIIDDAPVHSIEVDGAGGFSTACPGCGRAEIVLPADSRERVVAVRYSQA
jgi:predicted RNA-binding Zn-ribbon protein involved in translation (DUF1610 family)